MWGSRTIGRLSLWVSFALAAALLTPTQQDAAVAQADDPGGGVFVTGHDADFHARSNNTEGARNIIRVAIDYVTWSEPDPNILVVTSRINPGRGFLDPVPGIEAAGFVGFDVADDGSAGGSVLDLNAVDFSQYDVVLVASDYGGWLRQGEVDVLNARSDELIEYINAGGGLVALAESGRLVSHDRYGFLPFLASDVPLDSYESGNSVTEFGASIGLTDADVNGNYSHNIFTETGGLEVVDIDAEGNVLSLATREPIDDGGVQPEPPPAFAPPVADAGPDQTVDEGSVVTLDATNSTASGLIAETYTTTSDFREGTSINLNDLDDQLRLDDTQEAFDFIWIAASGRGTVIKIDTQTGEILGEYWSAPQNRSKNPSRTTVDKDGNVWVGNRDESSRINGARRGSVSEIGLVENGQCVDRNGNGVIETSTGLGDILAWPNAAGEDTAGGVTTAVDECILQYVRTNGRNIRHVSVDVDNHVWVGGDGFGGTPRYLDRITPDGEIVRSINMASGADTGAGSVPCCYGGLIDPEGILWTAGSNRLVRIDPSKPNGDPGLVQVINAGRTAYGMGIDPDGFIWLSNWTSNTIQKYAPDGARIGTYPTGGPSRDRGVAVTDDGDVWVANSGGASVSRLSNSGTFIAEIGVGVQPTGVAVDPAGMVWAANLSSSTATRIDPATNAVDLVVDLGSGAAPYNYSDMTGSTLSGAPDEGTWSVAFDSNDAATEWALIDWTADVSGDGSIAVLVATSEDGVVYGPDIEVQDAEALSAVVGRYIRVTVRFERSSVGESPVMYDLSIARPGGEGELTYQWDLIDGDGPPIFLSSSTSATPSFVAPDDGTYLFELTVTDAAGLTDTDRVTVVVENLDPVLTIEPGAAFAGGVTLVNASFTDPGWLDTHSATVDWGDGTVDDIVVTAQGTGWGTFFGSHVFESAGTYAVTVTAFDDDGGSATASVAELTVADPVAVWANSETEPKTLNWSGASGSIEGRVHSNNELRFVGQSKTVIGPATYAGSLSADTDKHMFDPPPALAPVQDYPIRFDVADYRPDGSVAVQVGDAYFDMSSACSNGTWHETQIVLDPGVYYADCDIKINGSNVGGRITLVSEGSIEVSGSRPAFEPYYDGLLFLAGATGDKAIELSASSSKFLGVLFAEFGEISVSGSSNRFYCGILGDTVDLSGGDLTIRAANCGRPDSTVSGPLLVPGLSLEVTADKTDVSPTETIAYQITITNDGALLVVPGLMGLENVDDAPATVDGFDFAVEYFSIADNAWLPLVALGDDGLVLDTSANVATGATYPVDGGPVGTIIDPDGLATWGFQGLASLTPEQVTMLLDPALTGGIRTRVDFTMAPATVQVRRLFTLGSDFIDQVRALSGDIADVDASVLLPEGDLIALDSATVPELAVLTPGQSVTTLESFTAAEPAPRGVAETDAGYLARLLAVDGTVLVGGAFAFGTGGVGHLVAPLSTASSTEHLPVVSIETAGPDEIPGGSTADYELALANVGSLDAGTIAVFAAADGEPLVVTGAPSDLVAGELAAAGTSYTAATDTVTGPIAIRGEVTWVDANGVVYGPVGSTQTALLLAPATMVATLTDALAADVDGDGFVSPGDTVRYTLTVGNTGGVPLTGIAANVTPDANSTLVVGSVQTDGVVDSGNTPGDTSVAVSLDSVVGGSAVPLTFDVTVGSPFPDGVTRLEVQGTVSADGFDPILTDDPALLGAADPTRTTVVVPAPNLSAFMTGGLAIDRDGNGYPSEDDRLRIAVLINSVGSLPVTGVELSVPTPEGTTLVAGSVTSSVGTVSTGTDVSVQLGTLASLENAEVVFDIDIDDPVPAGVTEVSVQGIVTSVELDPTPTDDPDTLTAGDPLVIPIGTGGGGPGSGLPGPEVGGLSLTEGDKIAIPTPLLASFTPPDGETVVSWWVTYRRLGTDQTGVIASSEGGAGGLPGAFPAGRPNLAFLAQVAGGEPIPIGTFDPTTLPGGTYEITVSAESSGGGISSESVNVVVDDGFKPGRWGATYQDMSLPFPGLPIQVLRTYDSFDKSTGDFGVGWTLDLDRIKVSTSSNLWEGWFTETTSCGLIFCNFDIKSYGPKKAYVTWPDGKVDVFSIEATGGNTFFPGLTSLKLVPSPGNRAQGQLLDTSAFYSNGTMLGGTFGSNGPLDIDNIVVTVPGGASYLLSDIDGLVSATSPSGEVLFFSDDGITSDLAGPQVQFVRDSLGRITQVIGPDGAAITYEYDAAGDLVRVIDALGNVTQFVYDADHNLIEIVDPLGRPFRTVEYDDDGRVIAVTDALGNRSVIDSNVAGRQQIVTDNAGTFTTVLTFDDDGNIIRVDELFDGDTLTTTFTYNADDLMTSRTDAQGNTWTTEYNGAGDPTRFTDPLGAATAVAYNEQRLPVTVTDPEGNATSFEYDSQGNPTLITDALGFFETFTYDGEGRRVAKVDREGHTVTWTYNSDGRMASVTDGTGSTSSFTYTDTGNVASITDPLGNISSFAYSASGQMTSMTDPGGNVTTWAYDAGDRLITETDALGNTATFAYDDADRLLSVTDPLGHVNAYTYDANGRVQTTVDPLGAVANYGRDGAGRLTAITNALGETTSFDLDEVGRTVAVTDPLGNVSTSSYDAVGRLVASATPSGATWTYGYDLRGLRTSVTDPLGNDTVWAYDALGRVDAVTDPRGSATSYDYDRNGLLTQVTDALGSSVLFDYDEAAQLVRVIDPIGLARTFDYDAAGNLLSASDPATGTTSYAYDASGQVASATDARGISVGFTYDALGRVTQISTPTGPILYEYDAGGRRISMADPTGVTTWGYDAASRITGVAAPQGSVSYAYDAVGRRISMTQPEGIVSYGYDAAGRPSSLTDWLGNSATLVYSSDDRLELLARSNGVSTSFEYDAGLRLDAISHTGPAGAIDSFDYTLDAAGNRTGVNSAEGSETYALDELGRLTQVVYPDGQSVAYTYDAAGNRLSETVDGATTYYTYDAAGRLASDGVNSYSYDVAGNTTAIGSDTYTWDWANRLVAATVAGESVSYTYDGGGLRVAATDSGGLTEFLWDRASMLPMLVSDGTSAHLHLGRQPYESITGASASFDLTDALGSVRATTDASGAVTGTASYNVFGGVRSVTGTLGTYGFTGEQEDPTGLLYLRARHYNPAVGRFLSADALQPNSFGTQGWNQYGYVAGNPSTMVDPTGYSPLVERSLLTAALGTAAVSAGFGFAISVFTCQGNQADGTFNGSYVGCVFRGTLAAGLAGFVSAFVPGSWGFFGSAFAAGVVDSAIFQGIEAVFGNGGFSLAQLLVDGLIGVASAGLASAAGSLWQRLKPSVAGQLDDVLARADDLADEATPLYGSNQAGDVTNRGSFRNGTLDDAWNNADPGPTGGSLCPTCGDEVLVPPNTGQPRDWDASHRPSWTNREFPPDVTRPEVLDNYNEGVFLECPSCNRGAGNNDTRFGPP